jgi:protein-L-isoaspartate O-methyltransferase
MPFRLSFTLAQADYQQLLQPQPAFPHGQFVMAADQWRLSAYSAALKAAITRAAAAKQQQQQQREVRGSDKSNDAAAVEMSVLDVGCGSGVLSLLAAAAAKAVTLPATALATASVAAAAGTAEGSVMPTCPAQQMKQAPAATAEGLAAAAAAAAATPCIPVSASVVGVELVAPLAAAALRNVALNGCSDSVSIVHGDAAMLERGAHVPPSGVDVVVFDCFDAGELICGRALLLLCVCFACSCLENKLSASWCR